MKPTSIAMYVNATRTLAADVARRIGDLAASLGVRYGLCDAELGTMGLIASCDLEQIDMVVSIGGDGTLLRAARIAHPRGLPIIGINTGRLGFLTEVEADEAGFTAMEQVLRGNYRVEERVALHAQVAGDPTVHFALNDVVVRRGAQARMAPFGLALDGEMIAHMPSDGIIVATPTGSTGYSLSAGGPIVHPSVHAIVVAGLMPHTLFARPLLVPSDATIDISCDGEITQANLETDGVIAADLHAGDRVTVRSAPEPVRFARVANNAFFTRLEEKLRWGVPIKR